MGKVITGTVNEIAELVKQEKLSAIIAIIGGAPDNASPSDEEKIAELLSSIIENLAGKNVAIATNGTNWGVPKYTCKYAEEYGLPIIRIYPSKADKYLIPKDYPLNIPIQPKIADSEWGDDSEVMIKIADGLIIIGGGSGTLIECAHWLKINESRIKYNKKIIYGVPIFGTGGVAELIYQIPDITEKAKGSFPEKPIFTGQQTVECLLRKIGLA